MSSPPAADRVEIAVLDRAGVIVSVNAAWNAFCTANDGDLAVCGPGTSYLAVCRAGGDRTSLQLAGALSAMLSGERATAITITIPCDGTEGERWFDVSAAPRLDDLGRVIGATVMLWVVERPPAQLSTTRRLAMVPDQEAVWDLIEAFPDGTVLVDDAGIISHANRQLERLTGHDRSDLVGAPIEVLLPAQLRARHGAWAQDYRDAPRARAMAADVELTLRRTDGREIPVEISLAPVRVGAQEMTMASVHDVTAQRASERSRQQLQRRTALVAQITSLVLSDTDPTTVYDEVVTGTVQLLVSPGQPSDHPHRYAGAPEAAPETARGTPSIPPGVRERAVAVAVEQAVRAVGRDQLSDDEAAMLTDLESQLTLVLELGIARRDRERLEMSEDRQRIGRDLHDTVIQALIGIGLQLAMSSDDAGDAGDADEASIRRDAAGRPLDPPGPPGGWNPSRVDRAGHHEASSDRLTPGWCRSAWVDGLACRPGSVPTRVGGDHPSRATVAGRLERSTHALGRAALRCSCSCAV